MNKLGARNKSGRMDMELELVTFVYLTHATSIFN